MNCLSQEFGFDSYSYFSYVLNKSHCSINEVNHDIKNLDLFVGGESGREISNCILIDNNIYCF